MARKLTPKYTRKAKTSDKSCVIRIRIDQQIKQKLQEIAKNEHRSLARQVGWCCERWLAGDGETKKVSSPFSPAAKAAAAALMATPTPAPPDLSALGLAYAESPEGRLERGLTISHEEVERVLATDYGGQLNSANFEKNGGNELRYYDPKTWKGEY